MKTALITAIAAVALAGSQGASAQSDCIECLSVRVGPPMVVRGPFPDELDASFTAVRLPDGTMRGFSANGTTYAVDGKSIEDMDGVRQPVMTGGDEGSINECGRWLTSVVPVGGRLLGLVHQEAICRYGPGGLTDKSMALASSTDSGLHWTDLGTVITGPDEPQAGTTSGEGDCSLVDGRDSYLYAYCLRASDWQTIVARAPVENPTAFEKYFEGGWSEPGIDGRATDIGFVGTGAGYLVDFGVIAAIANDSWFGGLRLSLSKDKVTFADLDEPLVPVDGSEWDRPAASDLIAYATLLDPQTGGNAVGSDFLLGYIFVPAGKGFEDRYLVLHEVSLELESEPVPVQVGLALTRWKDDDTFFASTGPQTDDREGLHADGIGAYLLTKAPAGTGSVRVTECQGSAQGRVDRVLIQGEACEAGYQKVRTAGWLFTGQQPDSVPLYRCAQSNGSHYASTEQDCDGLGFVDQLLGYGLAS